jgi:hypothetical protein
MTKVLQIIAVSPILFGQQFILITILIENPRIAIIKVSVICALIEVPNIRLICTKTIV